MIEKNTAFWLTTILFVFYTVGFVGIAIKPDLFLSLSQVNLLLTAVLLFWLHPQKTGFFYVSLGLIFFAAFTLEWMGVNTGLIFGKYTYGNSLGLKIANTPIIIGLNWIIVSYSALQFTDWLFKKLRLKMPELAGAFVAAILMVLLDLVIEPLAPKLDFWQWEGNYIPIQNYTAWFFFGFSFCYWLLKNNLLLANPIGWKVYAVQLVFFIGLYFVF